MFACETRSDSRRSHGPVNAFGCSPAGQIARGASSHDSDDSVSDTADPVYAPHRAGGSDSFESTSRCKFQFLTGSSVGRCSVDGRPHASGRTVCPLILARYACSLAKLFFKSP